MEFEAPRLDREQMVLFAERLDEIIGPEHPVRLLDEILQRVDWSLWEERYERRRGRPPIHPQVIASAILYGIQKRIRASRAVEEAVDVRCDFKWLVHGRAIDHSTISEFRTSNHEALKGLFVQVVLIAQQLGHLPLQSLGFDGTKIRSNNRRSGTRTPEQLGQAKEELAARFEQLNAEIEQADRADDERLGKQSENRLSEELADVVRRKQRVDAAVDELEQIEASGLKMPTRLPVTDPESRVGKNKEGGFAPNHTPYATVDIDSGIVVDGDVIFGHHEDRAMLGSLDKVKKNLQLEQHVVEVLADGLMSSGENLQWCEERSIDLISPIKLSNDPENPARRDDLCEPVAEEAWSRLPSKTTKNRDGSRTTTLSKEAFVYDAGKDCYHCPAGKSLPRTGQSTEKENGRNVVRYRYESDAQQCAGCPLMDRCVNKRTKHRMIRHTEYETLRLAHAEKMSSEQSQRKYARRRHPGERPFAIIKHHFGARQFLLRSRAKVRQEWDWLTTSFNLHRLMSLIHSNPDPPVACTLAS